MPPLEENERVLYTTRKHWFALVGGIIVLVALALLPSVLLFAPHLVPAEILLFLKESVHLRGNFIFSVLFLWSLELLALWIFFVLFWTDYYFDVWFVTNFRVIAIDQRGMFNRSISTFRLDVIQDATVDVPGVLATLIDFGTVRVQTASDESFRFRGARAPNALKEKIMEEHHRIQGEKQEVSIKPTVEEQGGRF